MSSSTKKLILTDGTEILDARAIADGNTLWFYVDQEGATLGGIFELMNDPEKTETITADEFGAVTEYLGFTDLFCIRKEDSGQINGGLKKAVN